MASQHERVQRVRENVYKRAEQAYENWVNGNRADCADECMTNSCITALVCDAMDTQDRNELCGILVERWAYEFCDDDGYVSAEAE